MANTVNDVMNVIANPDYGIRNIAGTNQEILAIMQGTHNSKNNIHTIVNDIKNLLQSMVGVSTKKKPVEIKGNLSKINQRHIQDILNETKGIRKSIDNLTKSIAKNNKKGSMPAVAKLSDKASEKVANAMVKSMEKQNKGGRLSAIIDSFSKLKDISIKDFFLGKQKMKILTKIFKEVEKDFNIKKKDLDNIIKLTTAAPEIVKSLKSIGFGLNRIIKNKIIKKLNDILVGNKYSILSISISLQNNKKVLDNASKVSKSLEILSTSLSKSIFSLFFASLFAKKANKGVKSIDMAINKLITLSAKLVQNKKDLNEASKVSKQITILSGNLLATSIFLSIIAVIGIPAKWGAKLLSKIVNKIIPIAKKLAKNNKEISKSVPAALTLTAFTGLMAVSSLFLATIAVTGIPALLGSILTVGIIKLNIYTCKIISKSLTHIIFGSIGMAVMSTSLILFGIALGKITNATKGVSFKQVGVIATLTVTLALAVAGIGFISIPIGIGSIAVGTMSIALHKFAKTLKTISDIGTIPTKLVYQTLNALKAVANFFKNNSLKLKAIKTAKRYKKILRPFGNTIKHLVKLKELGIIPMKLVHQTLNAIGTIANYYIENPIKKRALKQAKRYKKILRPFGKTLSYLTKLKELGVIPMKLVHQTLNAMSTIANYYIDNKIKKKAIKQAKRYKDILKPFGKTLTYLTKLKDLGVIPMKLVHQTLNAMSTIANYYIDNKIKKKAIRRAKRYKKVLRHFGKTLTYLTKLKELGIIPVTAVKSTLISMGNILTFYETAKISDNIEFKSETTKIAANNFANMSTDVHNKLSEIKEVSFKNIFKSILSMKMIIHFIIWNSLTKRQVRRAKRTISILKDMSSIMSELSTINSSQLLSVGKSISNSLSGVESIDISKVQAVTDMFNAFNGINKSESIINKFTESVNEFTTACKNLIDAMGDNTNAINNIEGISVNEYSTKEILDNNISENSSNGNVSKSGIQISNVEEIAKTIAEKINGALYVDVPDTQVQLLINGVGGNEWTISRY